MFGPGAFDMKAGLTVALFALRTIRELTLTPNRPISFLFTPREELGGRAYRHVLEAEARRSHCVLVLEPPAPGGAVKTARKGTAKLTLRVSGQTAHAGLEPEKGVSAITELAHQILRLVELNDLSRGVAVNVGLIQGGLRPNIVADRAEAQIDVRFPTLPEGERVLAAICHPEPVLEGARLEVIEDVRMPPLERTESVVALYRRAKVLAGRLGFDLPEASVGGASEGCLTAALGVPTLDGLGPAGAGAHAVDEHVLIPSLAERAALLVCLLLEL